MGRSLIEGRSNLILVCLGLFIIFITVAFIIDVRYSKLPNKLTMCGTLFGVLFHTCSEGWNGLLFSLIGAGTGFIMVLVLYAIGALGAGDVKLFAAIGAIMGVMFVVQTLVYAILWAGLIGLFLLLFQRKIRTTSRKLAGWLFSILVLKRFETFFELKQQKNIKFPFMYAVFPAVAVTIYYSLL
ncbi:A24 family peptidase [Paenibacillus sp. LjRoot56]|uniref:A24 family peptidase n=1 Tax=Paenibacillus sp. LjRoot56 TaxID=3342333 RepID=UPI003F4FAF4C